MVGRELVKPVRERSIRPCCSFNRRAYLRPYAVQRRDQQSATQQHLVDMVQQNRLCVLIFPEQEGSGALPLALLCPIHRLRKVQNKNAAVGPLLFGSMNEPHGNAEGPERKLRTTVRPAQKAASSFTPIFIMLTW